jgi:transcriptional regulator with XRE-family HTH domain
MSLERRETELRTTQTLLRELRQQAELTQQEMAARLGTPQSFVSKYEAGTRRLDIFELRRVLAALEMPLDEFIRLLDERVPLQ